MQKFINNIFVKLSRITPPFPIPVLSARNLFYGALIGIGHSRRVSDVVTFVLRALHSFYNQVYLFLICILYRNHPLTAAQRLV
jgi:hypothetical protein